MYRSNDEERQDGQFGFTEQSVRNSFIRKVYSILVCQLTVAVGIICLFLFHEDTRVYVYQHREIWWGALGISTVIILCLICCGDLRRHAPLNYIFLAIFTITQGLTLAVAASTYSSEEVLLATVITTVVCLGLTVFAFQTKYDFTGMGSILFVALLILLVSGIIFLFLGANKIMSVVYSSIAVFLFSIYLIYDTQIMIGGKHQYHISPEEYILAALQLYLDIILILFHILNLISGMRS